MTSNKITKQALLTFTGFAVLFAILATIVALGVTRYSDPAFLYWINANATPSADTFFIFITQFGGVYIVAAMTALIAAILFLKKKYNKAIFVIAAVGGIALLNMLLKTLFDRPRPDLWEWLVVESSFSFPSGHSAASATLAIVIVLLLWNTRFRLIAIIVASIYVLIVGLSRMYLGVHYPSDVVGGWLLAGAWVSLLVAGFYAYKNTMNKKKLL